MPRAAAYRTLLAAILLMMLMPAALVRAQEHQLAFDRDRPVGSKYQITAKASKTEKQSQKVNGQPVGNNSNTISASMTAVAEVLALHEDKRVRSVKLSISKFEGKAGDQDVKIDQNKPIVGSVNNGQASFTYEDGTALPEGAEELIDLLSGFMLTQNPQEPTQDKVFKLDKPHAKGSSWEGDNKLIAEQLSDGGQLTIDPENIKSQFQFLDIAPFAGQQAAVFDATVTFDKFAIGELAQVPGLTVTKSDGTLKLSGLLPLDVKSGDGAVQMQLDMAFGADIKAEGATVQIGFEFKIESDAEFREIK